MALIQYTHRHTGDLITVPDVLAAHLDRDEAWQRTEPATDAPPADETETVDEAPEEEAPVIDTPAIPVRATRPRKGTRTS